MTLQATGWTYTVVLSDQGGNPSKLIYSLVATNYTDAAVAAATIIAALTAVTDLAIKSTSLSENYDEDTLVYGTAEAENVALIVAKLTTAGKTVNIRIPGPKDALFVAASGPEYNVVDPSNTALQDYLAIWEALGLATISDGETIRDSATAGNFSGHRIHRGSRKG